MSLREASGVNVTIKDFGAEKQRRLVELVCELGFRWVRLEFDWYGGHQPGDFEPFVEAAERAGVKVLGLLTGLVPGTLRNVFGNARYRHPLSELEAYVSFVESLARHFRGRILHWEVWNEENTARFWLRKPSAREFHEVLVAAAASLRSIHAENRVIYGSICGNDIHKLAPGIPLGFLQEALALGAADYCEVLGFHPYTTGCYVSILGLEATWSGVAERIEAFAERYQGAGRELWVTEIGVSRTWIRLRPQEIAELYHRILERCASLGMLCFFWCLTDFDDPIYGPGNPEKAFGFVRPDLEFNEVGQAWKARFLG